jgi:ubiquinone/menaquinone biosynthesis C-methylase UbiE
LFRFAALADGFLQEFDDISDASTTSRVREWKWQYLKAELLAVGLGLAAVGSEAYTISSGSLNREQMVLRDAEAPRYERSFSLYEWASEKEAVRVCISQCTPGRILDAGGGVGVYTSEVLARKAEVVVVDFSIRALEVNRAKNSRFRANLELVLADVVKLPFCDEAFQGCLLFGVLSCLSDNDGREALLEARRILQPQGTLCLSVYNHSLFSRLRGDREGWHRTAYPRLKYRRFTYGELRKMLLPNFLVIRMRGYENLAYLDRLWELAIRLLGSFVVAFDATLSQVIPLSLLISENLLAFAEPRFRTRMAQPSVTKEDWQP